MKIRSISFIILSLFLSLACRKDPVGNDLFFYLWDSADPESRGMNSATLESAFEKAEELGFVDGILVLRNGVIVGERYYNGYRMFSPHNVMSVSKSFLSAMTGIALENGIIDSLGCKALDYFPEYRDLVDDERKFDITIRHLLTMHMGIPGESTDGYRVFWELVNSENWVRSTIEYPLIFDPGGRMAYNTFETHLLSAILTKATGMSTLEFAKQVLTGPMGIAIYRWTQDPQGYYFGGSDMYFNLRQTAALGILYLNGGKMNGVQIVPEEWVALTTAPFTNWENRDWGSWKNYNYGYLWWTGRMNGYDMFLAYGYGGQFVAVFPDLDLVIATFAKNNVDPDTSTVQEWALFDIMTEYILPSIQ